MILDVAVNKYIEKSLVAEQLARNIDHVDSGLLSAGYLYQPLRCQILKTIGVPRKVIEPYVLGKFKRGQDVEDWFVNQLETMGVVKEKQKEVKYRNVIGFVDATIDSDALESKKGIIPLEVKSVTNMKLKRIQTAGVDWHYQLQAALYALAMNATHYAVAIVSAEDLRPSVYVFDTANMKPEVDKLIDEYDSALINWKTNQVLPDFVPNPKVMWTANPAYSNFDEFWCTEDSAALVREIKRLKLV